MANPEEDAPFDTVGEAVAAGGSCAPGVGPGPRPVPEGTPVAGMTGVGLVAAACVLGGALTLRKK